MLKTALFMTVLWLSMPASAQQDQSQRRADHYIDHIVLGINDLDTGVEEIRRLTGVSPRSIGRNRNQGTHSAVISLGEKTYLEIIAPDPKADGDPIDPEIDVFLLGRLAQFSELTPVAWAIGTHNLDRTIRLSRQARVRFSDITPGTSKSGWGRAMTWSWAKVSHPLGYSMPEFVEWPEDGKKPQDKAPGECSLTAVSVLSRVFNPVQVLLAVTQIDAEAEDADEDALGFAIECDGEEVVFEPVPLSRTTRPSGAESRP